MIFRSLLHWLRTNLTSLVLSMLLGMMVWIVASQTQNPVEEKEFESPVAIAVDGLGSGLLITNEYPETAMLRLRAQQSTWDSLSAADILVTADLSGLGPGIHHVPLGVDIIAPRTRLVSSNPSSIQVDIEEERQREMPVHVNLTDPATSFVAEDPIIDPPLVTVKGPRSAVDLVSDVQADASLAGLQEDFSAELQLVAVDVDDNTIDEVSIEPSKAQVTVPIVQEPGHRTVLIVASYSGTPEDGYYVANYFATPNSITVRGEPEVVDNMESFVETETVNVGGLTDNLTTNVELKLPPGVTPATADPVQVVVIIEPRQGNRPLEIPVKAVGLGDDLEATFSPETVTVILAGPLPILRQLNIPEDVIVTVDLTGMEVGSYQLRPTVELLRSDITIESKSPAVISVTIARALSR